MSFFNNNKLFLKFNPDSLIDTPKRFAFDEVVLDKNVARELNLHSMVILFIKNTVTQNDNDYFNQNMVTPNFDILNSNIKHI